MQNNVNKLDVNFINVNKLDVSKWTRKKAFHFQIVRSVL